MATDQEVEQALLDAMAGLAPETKAGAGAGGVDKYSEAILRLAQAYGILREKEKRGGASFSG
jgi:hypothetical protein